MSGSGKAPEGSTEEEELGLNLKETLNLVGGRRPPGWQELQAVLKTDWTRAGWQAILYKKKENRLFFPFTCFVCAGDLHTCQCQRTTCKSQFSPGAQGSNAGLQFCRHLYPLAHRTSLDPGLTLLIVSLSREAGLCTLWAASLPL